MDDKAPDNISFFFTKKQKERLSIYKAAIAAGFYNEGLDMENKQAEVIVAAIKIDPLRDGPSVA